MLPERLKLPWAKIHHRQVPVELDQRPKGQPNVLQLAGRGPVVPVVGLRVAPVEGHELVHTELPLGDLRGELPTVGQPLGNQALVAPIGLRGAPFPRVDHPPVQADKALPRGLVKAVPRNLRHRLP
ncbi:MAG: hypothetical protein DWQ01_13000 [Planctomycetota bacterium]|nr:MAG: hypothetical protein DWQ01_13000 [Planctomycetota bacterium]